LISRRGFFGIAAGAVAGTAVAKLPAAPVAPVAHTVVFTNPRREIGVARYTWGSFHDGFGDDYTQGDLAALLRENMETLKQGFEENFDLMLRRTP
jgi:hypothetical protein